METSWRNTRWTVAGGAELIWRNWDDDEYVVYSTASGDTHLVNRVTAEILRQLYRAGLEPPALARNLARSLGVELSPQLETHVERLLVHLDRIGLIEPAS